MANNPGAKKSIRKIARRTEVNKARRSRVRTYLRKFEEALVGGDAALATAAFIEAQSELMRAVSKGVVHKNTGSRKVSRLAARLKKLATACQHRGRVNSACHPIEVLNLLSNMFGDVTADRLRARCYRRRATAANWSSEQTTVF